MLSYCNIWKKRIITDYFSFLQNRRRWGGDMVGGGNYINAISSVKESKISEIWEKSERERLACFVYEVVNLDLLWWIKFPFLTTGCILHPWTDTNDALVVLLPSLEVFIHCDDFHVNWWTEHGLWKISVASWPLCEASSWDGFCLPKGMSSQNRIIKPEM